MPSQVSQSAEALYVSAACALEAAPGTASSLGLPGLKDLALMHQQHDSMQLSYRIITGSAVQSSDNSATSRIGAW